MVATDTSRVVGVRSSAGRRFVVWEAFKFGEGLNGGGEKGEAFFGESLNSDRLHKCFQTESSGRATPLPRWQDVIASRGVVAGRHW